MTPQSTKILKHLQVAGSITGVEAAAVYKARHLPSKIHEIKQAGFNVRTTMKHDMTGQRYASYSIGV